MNSKTAKNWKRKHSELILNTKFFKVRKDIVELPNGQNKDWIYWDSPDSAMVIGFTKENKLVMNRQYRYLAGEEALELPAGYFKKGESAPDAARREFEEESGYKCGSLVKLGSVFETYGQLNRQNHIFFTNDLIKSRQNLDPDEDIKVTLVDFEKAVQMVLENKIPDMGSAFAILLFKEKVESGEINLN